MQKVFTLGLLTGLVLLSCGRADGEIDTKLVLATIRPYALIASEIAGGRLRVETLLPVSASPHTWSPRPSDVKRISRAGIIIANGMGLEEKLGSLFREHAARTVTAEAVLGAEAGPIAEHVHDGEGEAHGTSDPHLWTDPVLMLRFAAGLAVRFEQHDPAGGSLFRKNLAAFSNSIAALDAYIRAEAGTYSNKAVVTFHDAFPRFFSRYGIHRVAAFMPTPGREPSAAALAGLGKKIRAAHVRALYREPQMDPKSVQVLAKEYDLPVYVVDPIGSDPGITNYTGLLRYNWRMLAQGFSR